MLIFNFFTSSNDAMAHVKWFVDCDVHEKPRDVFAIMQSHEFFLLFVCALLTMLAVFSADEYLTRKSWPYRVERLINPLSQWMPYLFRGANSVFFLALACMPRSVLLTPELSAIPTYSEQLIRALQFIIGICVVFNSTLLTAAIGIVILFALATAQFGLFHLLDYLFFPAIAFSLCYLHKNWEGCRRILRFAIAWTLMWGGIEKLAFPQWSLALLERPDVTPIRMGFTADFFVMGAAFVEFSCAFLVITGRASANVCALVLLFFLNAAIALFGLVDAIGHLLIVVVLLITALSSNSVSTPFFRTLFRHSASRFSMTYGLALLAMIALYIGSHTLLLSGITHEF